MAGPLDPIEALAALSRDSLDQVERAIAERNALTTRFLHEISKEIDAAKRMLDLLGQPWQRGDRVDYEVLRSALDRAFTARMKDRRAELLRSWKDLRDLHERRLELLREAGTLASIDGIGVEARDAALPAGTPASAMATGRRPNQAGARMETVMTPVPRP